MSETGYRKLLRCVQALWRSRDVVPDKDEPARDREARTIYRRYCIAYATDYVARAELAWPGNGPEFPHSMSGADHLMEHIGHDLALSERDEITFRDWWRKAMNTGFTMTREKAAA